MLRSAFDSVRTVSLEITPDAETAIRMLAAEPYDLVAVDPAIASGGFALLKHVKDNYRWTATLVATHNQDPQFLRQAVKCRIDGLLFRPATSAEFVEQALLLAKAVNARRRRQQKRVLAIGAHPDDVEIGCGGALAKHHADYDVLHILTLSRGAAGGDVNVRAVEAHNAAALVGARLEMANLRDTYITDGAETISIIEAAIRELQPRMSTRIRSRTRTRTIARSTPPAWWRRAACPTSIATRRPSSTVEFKPHRFVDITHYIEQEDRPDRRLQEPGRPHGVDPARRHPVDGALLGPLCRLRAGRAAADRPPARQRARRSIARGSRSRHSRSLHRWPKAAAEGAKHAHPDHRRGRRRAISVWKSLSAEHELHMADMDPLAAGLYLVPPDRRLIIPRGDAPELVPALHRACKERRIEALLPTVDAELAPVAAARDSFAVDRRRAADLARRMPAHLPRQAAPDGSRAGQGADSRQRAADRGRGRARRFLPALRQAAGGRGRAASPRSTAAPISTSSPRTAR